MMSKPLNIIVYIHVTLESTFERFAHKDAAWKTEFFASLFLENKTQADQNNKRTMVFMSKQVGLPKLSLILHKMKISPNPKFYALFA